MSVQSQLILDVSSWFVEREMKFKPPHFITATTPVTTESSAWITHHLKGRYVLCQTLTNMDNARIAVFPDNIAIMETLPSFEDPHEAILYELMWS